MRETKRKKCVFCTTREMKVLKVCILLSPFETVSVYSRCFVLMLHASLSVSRPLHSFACFLLHPVSSEEAGSKQFVTSKLIKSLSHLPFREREGRGEREKDAGCCFCSRY